MIKTNQAGSLADRLERSYLSLLRVLTLVVATICIVGAVIFALDGARRALTPTQVQPQAVAVTADETLGSVIQDETAGKDAAQTEQAAATAEERKALATFMAGPFETYYQGYRKLAATHSKSEDRLLTKAQLAEHLGYTLDAVTAAAPLAAADAAPAETDAAADAVLAGFARTAKLFVTDAAFAQAQSAAVTKAAADPRLLAKARTYQAAQKTAQACRTDYEVRTVWDSNSTVCRDWYLTPYGCSVRRQVPVERCEPAYPEGIKSPLALFTQLDESYRLAWHAKTMSAEDEAAAKTAEKEMVKAAAPASLLLALQIGGAFLVIMFLFLLIAVERHLRRVASDRPAGGSVTTLPLAAE